MAAYSLNYQGIDQAVIKISDFLNSQSIDRKEIIKTRLSLEEILMKYKEQFSESASFELSCTKRLGQIRVMLKIKGAPFDPNSDISEEDQFYNACLQNMGKAPIWKYHNGENRISITFSKKKKLSLMALQIIAIVSAVVLGFSLRSFIPSEKIMSFCESFLDPVNGAITGLLAGASVFFIFFSIINGISNMGDMATFNKIGKKVFKRIFIILGLSAVAICLLSTLAFPIASGGNATFDVAGLWKMIVDIVPINFVDSFLQGNMLQISFLAIVFGIIILILGDKAKSVSTLAEDCNNILMLILQGVITLLPFSVFLSVFELIVQDNLSQAVGIYKFPLYIFVFEIIFILFFVLRTCITQHVSPILFIKKILPVLVIAFTTASSSATIMESFRICETELGIDKQMIHMGWPINNTFLAVDVLIDAVVASLAAAECFNVPVSVTMLITLGINACILSMAVPKISGAMISIYTILFATLGIPTDILPLLITMQIITDRIGTATGSFILHTELVQQAATVGLLNKEVLQKA